MNLNTERLKLYFLIGLPGSGKSTYCSNNFTNLHILSSDNIREKLFGNIYSEKIESIVFDNIIKETIDLLNNGNSVVLDTTYFNTLKNRKVIMNQIKNHGIKLDYIAIYFNIDVQECIKRNYLREKHRIISEKIIYELDLKLNSPMKNENFLDVITV